MVNRKQTDGQNLCICGHKEFHHITSDGKDICCMGGCDCEDFRLKNNKVHYKDMFTKESECGEKGSMDFNIEEVTCLKCLNSIKKEWTRQVKEFNCQPRLNALEGLKRTTKRISELKNALKEKK